MKKTTAMTKALPAVLILLLLLWAAASGCGAAAISVVTPLSPNVEHACMRAVRCQVFAEHEFNTCVNCLEHIDYDLLTQLRKDYGDLPPLDEVDCDTLLEVCNEMTNVAQCVHEQWYGS